MLKKFIFKALHGAGYYFNYKSLLHHSTKQRMMDSYVVEFNDAEKKFLEQAARSINYVIDYSLGLRQKEQFLLTLNDVTFLGNSGALVHQGSIVVESVMEVSRLGKSTAFKTPAVLVPKQKKGLYTSVLHLPLAENSNYHWFFDCVPRLYFLLQEVKQPIHIIMRPDLPAYQLQTLEFIIRNHPHAKIVYIKAHEKWNIAQFILPSFVANSQSAYLPLEVGKWLQEKIWKGYEIITSNPGRKIYISRANTRKRRVLNERELLPILTAKGFEIIRAEELTYEEQVRLFYDAEVIIAPHGAGLTNLLFSRQCRVLELHPANLVKTHYFLLCKGLGFDYTPLIGTDGNELEDYSVDTGKVEAWLQDI